MRTFEIGVPASFSAVDEPPMARPRRLKDPVKLNLLIEKNYKDLAMQMAAERQMSVSRLFVWWLLQDLNGRSAMEEIPVESLGEL